MENGDIIWDDGRTQLHLPFDHKGRQLERKQESNAILLSGVICSVIALVNLFKFLRGKYLQRRRTKMDDMKKLEWRRAENNTLSN
jgi:hypothetical protein